MNKDVRTRDELIFGESTERLIAAVFGTLKI